MTPRPCDRPATIVDRHNKPLNCFKGHSIRSDIWIQPNKGCPRFMSHRCTPCQCIKSIVCANGQRRRVTGWVSSFIPHPTIKGAGWRCCKPQVSCLNINISIPDAPPPAHCKKSVCPFGGNPDNPDPQNTWDDTIIATPPCPAAPFCRPPLILKEMGMSPTGCRTYSCAPPSSSIPGWCKTAYVNCASNPLHVCCGH